ncbi:MAG: peptide deformylase [Alphaproteobacteria bacterium GM202ARS2]|nr:peptide deformylase [Alphaproteobacteria bacterium GM202ARS2]
MTIKPILIVPDRRLTQTSQPVSAFDASLTALIDDLRDTLIDCDNGIGLAAPQIGVLLRVFALRIGPDEQEVSPPTIFINPAITHHDEQTETAQEGCLSIPDTFIDITRPQSIQLSYTDEHNQPQSCSARGLFARCLQHENDHLNGVLLLHRLSPLKRRLAVRKVQKSLKPKKNGRPSPK